MEKLSASERQAELAQRVGTVLGGRYRLDRLLGVGGMGGVYEARPTAGGDPVAVKLLSVADPASRERIAGRFAREAKAVSAVRCPHIVSILEAGSESGRPFIAMELLRGEDLGQRLRRLGKLPLRDTLHVAAQILVGLGTAHEAGIVHRDLKPDNVFLLDKDGDPFFCKLLDFGMSKLTPGEN
ncbi:MAG TPA: serine/threonine-protein kinase, partial [Polyangiaceae bacterium]|nr:serine/threonine-protein kinase [Polyangiaceae bacterium]